MHIVSFLLVLVVGATLLVLLDIAIGTIYRGNIERLIHVIAFAFWGALLFAVTH